MTKNKKATWESVPDPAYDYTCQLTADGWAWEFLRRGNPYRAAYKKFIADTSTAPIRYDPPRNEGEDEKKWKHRVMLTTSLEPRIIRREEDAGRPFGLVGMFDAWVRYDATVIKFQPLDAGPLIATAMEDVEAFLSSAVDQDGGAVEGFIDSHCILVFDLTANIDHQKTRAVEILGAVRIRRGIEPKPKAPHRDPILTDYLRALDLIEKDATVADIGQMLWPSPPPPHTESGDHAKAILEQARAWIEKFHEFRRMKTP